MVEATPRPQVYQEGQVQADGFQIRYREAGQGDLVVILEADTWGLSQLPDALAQSYRVLRLELPGFGESPANTTSASIQDLASTAFQAIEQLVPGHYTLIGVSFSANVALWQTLQNPEPVDALVLISPTSLHPTGATLAESSGQRAAQLLAHPEKASELPALDSTLVAKEQTLIQRLGGSTHDGEAEGRLLEIPCATLVVFGSKDLLVSAETTGSYRANIPTCNVSLVYDAGHLVAAERPEALINAVSDYVENRETFIVGRQSSVINP